MNFFSVDLNFSGKMKLNCVKTCEKETKPN